MNNNRENFSGKFGIIAAAAGSAIGLGNIWRFPYMVGENGGGIFLLFYLFFIFGIGIPVMLSELSIGRSSGSNVIGSFKKLAPGSFWWLIGLMGVIAAFIILAFYSTVAGWTLEYISQSIQGSFFGKDSEQLSANFVNFTSDSFWPVFWQIIFMLLTAGIVMVGVQKGIEKFTKILMPLLLVMIIFICIRSLSLEGSSEGLKFLFMPNFDKISIKAILMALGQAAFSLSIGMGALITYGSYTRKDTSLLSTSIYVASADTLVAVLSGVMIFPALFALGESTASGPSLLFITLPKIFQSMVGGYICSIVFFILVAIAALTSTISLLEVVVAFIKEEFNITRLKACIIATLSITCVGVFCTLSFGPLRDFKIFDKTFFDLMDYISANILLTFGALFIIIFTGWKFGKQNFVAELNSSGKLSPLITNVIFFIIKYVAPIAIGIVAINAFTS